MNGHDYIAVVPLYGKTATGRQQVAEAGARCDRVASSSLSWLLKMGHIIAAPAPAPDAPEAAPHTGRRRRGQES